MRKKGGSNMESEFAKLDSEKLQEINKLEDKLGVTLIAYDTASISDKNQESLSNFFNDKPPSS